MNLELILTIIAGLVGLPALWAVVIDVLKRLGVVTDGNAGLWSAGFNLVTLIVVAVLVNFVPTFDFTKVDNALIEVAQFAALIVSYLFQIIVTKVAHKIIPEPITYSFR